MNLPTKAALSGSKISQLGFSEAFKLASDQMGYETLGEILATPASDLFKKQGFDYIWFGELIRYLNDNGLADLLQPLPGRSRD